MYDYNEDEEIKQIFSKHLNSTVNKVKVNFDNKEIKENQLLLDKYIESNLITQQSHFCLEDKVEDEEEAKEKSKEDKENKLNSSYFKSIYEDTLKNDSLYCSYLDTFDKFWVKNSKDKLIFRE
jgi:hypothetical protein